MDKTAQESTSTPNTSPSTAAAKPVKKGGASKMIIVVIIGVLLLCCCVSTAGAAGYFVYQNNKDKDKETTSEKTTKKSTEQTTSMKAATPPTAGKVKDEFMAQPSYRFTGEIYYDEYKETLTGEFLAPGDEYVTTEEDMAVTEEVTIDGTHYLRAQGGTWEETDDPYNAMFQYDEVLHFFNGIKSSNTAIDSGQYWEISYVNPDYGDEWILLVSKDTNLPYKLTSFYENNAGEQVNGTFWFSDYGDTTISIEAPI